MLPHIFTHRKVVIPLDKFRSPLLGHGMALFVTIVWGTTLVSSKILLQGGLTPLEILVFRFILAWLALFLLSPRPLKPKAFRSELPYILAGVTGLTLYFLLENTALQYTLASSVAIIISTAPMFSALFMWLFRRAGRPKPVFFLGFVLSMIGIILISVQSGEDLAIDPIGDLLTVGAAMVWGIYGVFIEMAKDDGLSSIQVTRKIFVWGLLSVIPLAPVFHLDLSLGRIVSPVMAGNLIYLGLMASAVCYVFWNKAVVLLGAVSTTVYIYLSPVVTLIASAIILREPVRPQAVAAIALILLGMWLSQDRPSK